MQSLDLALQLTAFKVLKTPDIEHRIVRPEHLGNEQRRHIEKSSEHFIQRELMVKRHRYGVVIRKISLVAMNGFLRAATRAVMKALNLSTKYRCSVLVPRLLGIHMGPGGGITFFPVYSLYRAPPTSFRNQLLPPSCI